MSHKNRHLSSTGVPKKAQAFDILCQVDDVVCPPEALTFANVEVQGDLAYLTIIIPSELLTDFQDFLRSTLSISNYVKTQARVKKAIQKARDLSYHDEQRKQFEKFSARILSKFDSCVNAGLSTREAIRETKAFFNKKEKYLTCYTIELIVRDAGRLSKRRRKE